MSINTLKRTEGAHGSMDNATKSLEDLNEDSTLEEAIAFAIKSEEAVIREVVDGVFTRFHRSNCHTEGDFIAGNLHLLYCDQIKRRLNTQVAHEWRNYYYFTASSRLVEKVKTLVHKIRLQQQDSFTEVGFDPHPA
jgi:hypothetical protein